MARTLALPIAVGRDRGLTAHEQDSEAEIAQSVALLADTRPGERAALPDYGLPDPVGSGLDADLLVGVVTEWEERADPADVEVLVAAAVQAAAVHPSAYVDTDSEES
ncbi:hypothetical protein [Nocardioides lianchengensis]|uniref:Uncharacterized protein n=1 Tax=Nocardioides lianchengensis TaxID=1045774 RepID=A0A1G6LT90_9ACTN|nr:hypothetical protein [Nocardioides lianchengensis]NYG12450.1 phage baseplate assembly protein W [Nocardioides lianchengensis]SDC46482.1 hypothetical protein SAMN05421872_102354 [Nocardioides lianchengensis]